MIKKYLIKKQFFAKAKPNLSFHYAFEKSKAILINKKAIPIQHEFLQKYSQINKISLTGQPIRLFSEDSKKSDVEEVKKIGVLGRTKQRFTRLKIKRLYEISKKLNILRYFRKELNEQKLLEFLRKVQAVTLLSIYEVLTLSCLLNYLDFFNHNLIYLESGGLFLAFGSLYLLQKFNKPYQNKIIKLTLYQSLIVSLSLVFTPAIAYITNPVLVPSVFMISATSFLTAQITNYYCAKKKWILPIATFAGGVFNTFLVFHFVSYFTFVAIGNNPFVLSSHNFWVKNGIYLINALFAWNTNMAAKMFKKGETEYMEIALNFYLQFVRKIASLLMYFLKKIKS